VAYELGNALYPVCGANDATIESLAGVDVIVIRVPKAPRRTGPVYIGKDPYAGTYVRRHEGDYVARPQEVDRMFREKSSQSSDGTILPHFTMADIDSESLRGYRQRFQTHDRTSVLNNYDDEAFLRGIVGYATDRETGKSGLTVAGLLLLGTSSALQEWRGRHLIDFRVEPREVTYDRRWLERIAWDGNLFRAYEMIYGRLLANQPASFQLKEGVRTQEGPVQIALREALVNLLVHADYGETDASLIVQRPEGYLLRNPGSSLIPASELLSGTRSEPRNPLLVRMFMRVGFAEEAGTGITQIVSAWRDLGFRLPSIDVGTERYEFSISLRYVHLISDDDRTWLATATHNWTQHEQLALVLAKNDGDVDNERLRAVTNLHPTDAGRVLSNLRDRAFLKKTGSGRATIYRLGPALPPVEPIIPEHDDQTNMQLRFDDKDSYIDDSDPGSDDKGSYIDDSDPGSDDKDVYSDDMHEIQGDVRIRLEQIASLSREQQRLVPQQRNAIIVALCRETPLSVSQIAQLMRRDKTTIYQVVRTLVATKRLSHLYPNRRTSPAQKYVAGDP